MSAHVIEVITARHGQSTIAQCKGMVKKCISDLTNPTNALHQHGKPLVRTEG